MVRSAIWSLSNSARTASILNTILPAAVVVSIRSDRLTRSAPPNEQEQFQRDLAECQEFDMSKRLKYTSWLI